MNIFVFRLFVLIAALLVVPVYAENKDGRPGDDFRKAAADYSDNASKAAQEAAYTSGEKVGHYLELSRIYREMARIKTRAANLADQNRWDDIHWDRYHQLEGERDKLMGKVDWSYTRSKKH